MAEEPKLRGFQDPATRAKAAAGRAASRAGRKPPRERTPGQRSAPVWPAGLTKGKVNQVMYAAVVMADAGASILMPTFWVTPLDRLNEAEKNLLAAAFSDEAVKHPRVLRLLAEITKYGARAGIIGALIVVAIPRLYRRGLIPEFLVPILQSAATATQRVEQEQAAPQAPEMERPEEAQPNRDAAA